MISRKTLWMLTGAFLLAAPLFLPNFFLTLLVYIGISSIVAGGIVLLTGIAGITSFGQAAFVGLGAYVTAILTSQYEVSPWLALVAALLLTACVASVLGAITFRLSGHYLALGTLCWGMAIFYLMGSVESWGGHTGLSGLPPVSVFGVLLESTQRFSYLVWAFTIGSLAIIVNILDSRTGRAIRALRRGSLMPESFGIHTRVLKLQIFVLSALMACAAGWLYAHFIRFVSPTPFGVYASIEYLFMIVLGGAGYVWGAVIGSTILTVLRQWLQDALPLLLGRTGNFETVVLGVLIILIIQRARLGVAPLFTRFLEPRNLEVSARAYRPLTVTSLQANVELLRVEGLCKTFGGLVALSDLSFSITTGDIVGLIGPNGAGKTTTFNLISGGLTPSAGAVTFDSESIHGYLPRQISALGLVRTFQHAFLVPEMTVVENVAIGAHRLGAAGMVRSALRLDRAEDRALLNHAAHQVTRVGLDARMHDLAGDLSLGEQKLLEVARALAAEPRLLLLDEPAAGLRHMEKRALSELLSRLRDEGMTLLLVEHDMDFVMSLVDRLVVMNFGRKLAEGNPTHVQQDPLVQEAYLGCAA